MSHSYNYSTQSTVPHPRSPCNSFETDCHGYPRTPAFLCTQSAHDLGSTCIALTECILSLRIGIAMLILHHSCPKGNDESPGLDCWIWAWWSQYASDTASAYTSRCVLSMLIAQAMSHSYNYSTQSTVPHPRLPCNSFELVPRSAIFCAFSLISLRFCLFGLYSV